MLQIAYLNSQGHEQVNFESGPVTIGCHDSESSNEQRRSEGRVVEIDDSFISPQQCVIEFDTTSPGNISLTNFGFSIALHSGQRVHRGKTVELTLPVFFTAGGTEIQIHNPDGSHSLDFALTELKTGFGSVALFKEVADASPAPQTLASWFDSLDALQRSITGSPEFFQLAARAVFNPGGLDGGMILKRGNLDPDRWEVAASFVPYPEFGFQFRNDIVDRVASDGKVVFHDAGLIDRQETLPSTSDLHSCIACPVFDKHDSVVAIAYGFRSLHRTNSRCGIRQLEAQFVQLTAGALSSAMARMQSEFDSARTKILLEQAFSPKVAAMLETSPEVLTGCDREVSVLFADLRGFTSIAERIGSRDTYRLLTDVMDRFSNIISDHDGVIIDFYGDGLSAFWNAPVDQPEHAHLACQAALEIAASLDEVNENWSQKLKQALQVSVGVNTGMARVGNSGSSTRLKYGPQGNTVNIASRLENATRDVGVPVLISGETAAVVQHQFNCRRVCNTQLKGIRAFTSLYQLQGRIDQPAREHWNRYTEALASFEAGDVASTIEQLTGVFENGPNDPAAEFLLQQALCQSAETSSTTKLPADSEQVNSASAIDQ